MHFDPGAAIGYDAEAVEHLAVQVNAGFESDTRRTVQLAHNHALGAVDHESPLRRHQRDLAHVNFLFLRAFFLA